nr:hypothetical protein [Tanacetum cinerariifolium]
VPNDKTSNTLHNAIIEAGGKDRPPFLASGNYVQWKSITKRYIDTKPNHDLIHYCLKNPPYKYTWADKVVPVTEVYYPRNHPTHYTQHSSTRSQQAATRNRGKVIVNSPSLIYDQKPSMVAEDDEMSKDKEIDKLMALIFLSFKKIYKPTNNNLRTSSNTSRVNQDNSLRINREQADWRDDTDDDPGDQELEAHYMYMAQIQEPPTQQGVFVCGAKRDGGLPDRHSKEGGAAGSAATIRTNYRGVRLADIAPEGAFGLGSAAIEGVFVFG